MASKNAKATTAIRITSHSHLDSQITCMFWCAYFQINCERGVFLLQLSKFHAKKFCFRKFYFLRYEEMICNQWKIKLFTFLMITSSHKNTYYQSDITRVKHYTRYFHVTKVETFCMFCIDNISIELGWRVSVGWSIHKKKFKLITSLMTSSNNLQHCEADSYQQKRRRCFMTRK